MARDICSPSEKHCSGSIIWVKTGDWKKNRKSIKVISDVFIIRNIINLVSIYDGSLIMYQTYQSIGVLRRKCTSDLFNVSKRGGMCELLILAKIGDVIGSSEILQITGMIDVHGNTLTENCQIYTRHGGRLRNDCLKCQKHCVKWENDSYEIFELETLKKQSPLIVGYSEVMCCESMLLADGEMEATIFFDFKNILSLFVRNSLGCQEERCSDRLLYFAYHEDERIYNSCKEWLEKRNDFSNLLFHRTLTDRILRSEHDGDVVTCSKVNRNILSIILMVSTCNLRIMSSIPSDSHQRLFNLLSSLSLEQEISKMVIFNDCILDSLFMSDLFHYKKHWLARLIKNAKFGHVDKLNDVYRREPCSKRKNVYDVLKTETTLRRTLIFPFHIHKTEKVNEQSCNFDNSSKKEQFSTVQKGHLNRIRKLLKESLNEIDRKSMLKKSTLKNDVVDLRLRHAEVQMVVFPVSRKCLDYTFEQIVAGASQHSPDIMRFDMHRLASFADYNYPDTPSAFEFVKAGWYATGLGKETACFVCNIKFSDWTRILKPFDVHVQLSPECPFLKGEDVEAVSVDETLQQNIREGTIQTPGREYELLTNGVGQINLSGTSGSENSCLQPHGFTNNHLSSTQNGHFVNDFPHTPSIDRSYPNSEIHNLSDNLTNGHQVDGFRHVNGDILPNREISVDNPSRSFNQSDYLVSNTSNSFPSVHANTNSESYIDRSYQDNHAHQNNHHFVPFTADIPQQRIPPSNPGNNHEYHLPPPISAFTTPKFPAYQSLNVRISSYQGFPHHVGQSPRVLAQAGMFYRGYSDRCSCFWCGIGLQNWSMEDDPWVEHARWSPRCQYMIDCKGEEFIALVQESYREEDPVFPEVNYQETMIAELQSMGFSTESIQSAIKTLRNSGRNVNIEIVANYILENMLTELVAKTNDSNMSKNDIPPDNVKTNNSRTVKNEKSQESANALDENSKSLYEETTAMKEQLTCKVCMDNSVSVVFLPCGHIVACGLCSTRLSKCPICRKFIREKVKTLMS